jgi:hypothetical protein
MEMIEDRLFAKLLELNNKDEQEEVWWAIYPMW